MGSIKDEMARIKKELKAKEPAAQAKQPGPEKAGSDRVLERPAPRMQKLQERKTGRTIVVSKGVVPKYQRPIKETKPAVPKPAQVVVRTVAAEKDKARPAAPPVPPNLVDSDSFVPIAPKQLGGDGEFKEPEAWVRLGTSTDPTGSGRRIPVRIGLDFGTAFTKVAIRAGDRVYCVDWKGVSNGATHFLSGEISEAGEGEVLLGRSPRATKWTRDLKLPLLRSNKVHAKELESPTAFLALVLRYVRAWAYRHPELGAVLRGRRPAWLLNIGCPTKSWEDSLARGAYTHMATSAWLLSQQEAITRAAAWDLLRYGSRTAADVGLDDLHIVPEFLAQIGGYVKSPQRKDGLHLLVDVGAGTLDIATFNVYRPKRDEENRFPIFACDVANCGTHYLMSNRAEAGERHRSDWSDTELLHSVDQLSGEWRVSKEVLIDADDRFGRKVMQCIAAVLGETRARRYVRAPEWREGLPVFLAGGGSEYELYGDAVREACARQHSAPKKIPFQGADVDLSKGTPFHRMSVAYGLTFDPTELGRILPRSEVEDDVPRGRPVERIHHEDLYSGR